MSVLTAGASKKFELGGLLLTSVFLSSPMASTFRSLCRMQVLRAAALQHSSLKVVPASTYSLFSRGQATAAAVATTPFVRSTQMEDDNNAPVPFKSLAGGIDDKTLKAITVKPFNLTNMTPVQSRVLSLLPNLIRPHTDADTDGLGPRDLLVKARTGTGKTLAFLVPAIEARLAAIQRAGEEAVIKSGRTKDAMIANQGRRIFSRTHVGTLILSPTRELATQIANEALRLCHYHDDFEVRLFTGGMNKRIQMRDFMKGRRDIVVATPGRLLDLLHSESEVKKGFAATQMFILDEADTLLDMGFRDDIEAIKKFLPPAPQRQTLLFSATVSNEVRQIARSTLGQQNEFIDTVGENDSPVHLRIPQYHTVLPSAAAQITHTLRLIAHDQLSNPSKSKIILFLATTKLTQLYATLLRELGKTSLPSLRNTNVYEIHSKRTMEARLSTSANFRSDKSGSSILVTSDVSARGVDYPGVTRVIQLGIPAGTEQYIHRVGRTGRAGTHGRGDLVLLPWEVGFLTWQLDSIPLKPLPVNELTSQVQELAAAYDKDPTLAFWGKDGPPGVSQRPPPPSRKEKGSPAVSMYPKGQEDIARNLSTNVESILPSLDEEAIKETFASMLGYYMSKSPELRVQKTVIVEGCKDWATDACGLPVPPYVSAQFLERLGFSDGRTKRFGRTYSQASPQGNFRASPWSGRGRQATRDNDRGPAIPRWAKAESTPLDPRDPAADPAEFKTMRYGTKQNSPNWTRNTRGRSYGDRNGGYGDRSGGYGDRSGGYGDRSGGSRNSSGYNDGGDRGMARDRKEGYGMRR
ncbi:P-loop containing nucleoside triphosphate hydrolase protein [Hysterangium stoloniferum]|nr:P-loop containing nucleoside triphosphate hydrolase protein [Hysterangium stoloniferum]